MILANAREQLFRGIADQFDFQEYRDGLLITTPQTLTGGIPVELMATFEADRINLTDQGRVAQELDATGIDIFKGQTGELWKDLARSLTFDPAMGAEPWELSLSAPQQLMGAAVVELADAAVRADALRVLAPSFRPLTHDQRIIRAVHQSNDKIKVQPRAKIRLRGGGERQTSFSASLRHTVYVQSASLSSGTNSGYDHALGVFSRALVDKDRRLVVLEGRSSQWERWQREGLSEIASVVNSEHEDVVTRAILDRAA